MKIQDIDKVYLYFSRGVHKGQILSTEDHNLLLKTVLFLLQREIERTKSDNIRRGLL